MTARLQFDLAVSFTDAQAERLSPARRAKAQRMRHAAGAWRIAAGSALVQALLAQAGIEPAATTLGYEANGKPVLEPACGLHISLSHAGNTVAAMLSSKPCGVDVERKRAIDVRAGRHIMSAEEMAHVQALNGDAQLNRFFELWALKESLAKWQGTGISGSLRNGTFHLVDGAWRLEHPEAAYLYPLVSWLDDHYVLASVSEGPLTGRFSGELELKSEGLLVFRP